MLDQINKALATLALHMTIMLDGSFSKKDAESIRADYDEQLRLAEENIKSACLRRAGLNRNVTLRIIRWASFTERKRNVKPI